MFHFIKNLFKKEIEKADIPLENLDKWYEEKSKPLLDESNNNIKFKFNEFNVLLNTLRKNIESLEKAEIKEQEKIQDKVKQVVLGHRENYVKRLIQFVNIINVPNEANHETAVAFCSNIIKELDEFSENTAKTFYTVQHLFADEVNQLASDIKRIDSIIKNIKDITENEKILKIKEIKENIQKLKYLKFKKEQLISQFEEQKTKLSKLEKDKIDTQNQISRLEKSEEYSDYLSMRERLSSITNSISDSKTDIIQMFSPLAGSLKKFKRITLENEDLIEKYSEYPVNALLADKELKIITLLEAMKKNILSGSLEIRDKKKEKILEKINLIHQDKLNQIISRYDALKNEKDLMLKKIKVNKAWLKNDELKYKLEHVENSLRVYKEANEELDKKIQGIDINKLKQELENKLKELTNVEVSIKESSSV